MVGWVVGRGWTKAVQRAMVADRSAVPTDRLTKGLHEPMMMVEIRGGPVGRQKWHHAVIGLLKARTPVDEPEAAEDPQVVGIDHQRSLEPRCLEFREGHSTDDLLDLDDRGVARRFPTTKAH